MKEVDKQRKEKYLSQGLCSRCGNKPLKTKTMCLECSTYHTERYSQIRKNLLAKGICTRCEKRPLKSETMCEYCLMQQKESADKRKARYIAADCCTKCGIRPLKSKCQCEQCMEKENKRNKAVKDKVYNKYGGYICTCCKETEEAFLTIDHINNDGAKDRKVYGSGCRFYWWLFRNNFPKGFQVLCWNCQWGKKLHGTCPHQKITQINPVR